MRYCAILFWLNQLCVRWVVQRNKRGLSQALLAPNDQAAAFQLPEDPRGALAAAVELCLRLLQGEVQPNRAVRLDVAVLPGNAGSVQQQRIEHLRVVADVPHGFVLEKKPRKRHIANTVPVILTDEKQAKRFAEKVLSASEKVKQWFEKLLKDLRAILDKAYNALKREKSWEQMELIRNNKQTLDMIADYYFEGMEGTKATNSDSAQSIIFSAKDADITSKQKAEYDEYVQNALAGAGNNANSSFDLAYASERLINDLKKQGADVSGYRHRIQDNDIRHIRNSHGISKEGAYGVTTGDLQAIPYIINNYTDVRARIRNGKLYGVVYALDHVDTTYYVEGDVKGRFLDGKQMIKVPLGHVPEEYRAEFGKKRSISEYPDKASSDVPETYVQDGQQSHASINNMPQTSEDVKFSRKDDVSVTAKDVQKLQKENDKLTQALDLVRQELKITQGHHVKPAVIDRLAGRILKDYQSTMPKTELVESITQLFDYIGNGERVIWDEVQAGAMNIALNVLDKSTQRNTEWYDATKPARDYLKNTAKAH